MSAGTRRISAIRPRAIVYQQLEGGAGVGKNHWIAWEQAPHTHSGPVDQTTLPVEVIINSKLFSWGQSMHQVTRGYTLKQLLKDVFGGIVFSRIP